MKSPARGRNAKRHDLDRVPALPSPYSTLPPEYSKSPGLRRGFCCIQALWSRGEGHLPFSTSPRAFMTRSRSHSERLTPAFSAARLICSTIVSLSTSKVMRSFTIFWRRSSARRWRSSSESGGRPALAFSFLPSFSPSLYSSSSSSSSVAASSVMNSGRTAMLPHSSSISTALNPSLRAKAILMA